MKIILVANGFPPTAFGGVEIYVLNIAKSLQGKGHRVLVFCRESNPSVPDLTLQRNSAEGISVIRVINNFKTITKFEETYLEPRIESIFHEILQEFQPELIHFNHLIALSAQLPSVASKMQVAFLTTLHDYWPICHRVHLQDWRQRRCSGPLQGADCYRCVVRPEKQRFLVRKVRRWGKGMLTFALRRKLRRRFVADAGSVIALDGTRDDFIVRNQVFRDNLLKSKKILAPSRFVRDVFHSNGYDGVEMDVLPLGVKQPSVAEDPTKESMILRIGFIGTMLPTKGVHILLKAFRGIKSKDVRLSLYGRDDADPRYSKTIRSLAKGDERISFKGSFRPEDRDRIFKEVDLLVVPSLVPETFSMVAREALVNDTPLIVSDVGALPEIVINGENGFLFPTGDIESLKRLLTEIVDSPSSLQHFTTPGPVTILTVEDHVERLLHVYAQVVES